MSTDLRRQIAAVTTESRDEALDVRLEHCDQRLLVDLVQNVRQLVPERERNVSYLLRRVPYFIDNDDNKQVFNLQSNKNLAILQTDHDSADGIYSNSVTLKPGSEVTQGY